MKLIERCRNIAIKFDNKVALHADVCDCALKNPARDLEIEELMFKNAIHPLEMKGYLEDVWVGSGQ